MQTIGRGSSGHLRSGVRPMRRHWLDRCYGKDPGRCLPAHAATCADYCKVGIVPALPALLVTMAAPGAAAGP